MSKKTVAIVIAVIMMLCISTPTLAFEDSRTKNSIPDPIGPSVYMSAEDKISFATEMDALYDEGVQKNEISSASREDIDTLLLQAANATDSEKVAINEELANFGIYEFEGQVINPGIGIESAVSDVTVSTPSIYYEAVVHTWTVTCGGYWDNDNWTYDQLVYANVGGPDGFGVGYTSVSGTYNTYLMSAYAEIDNGESGSDFENVTTTNRSDGNGSLGFGFRLQDYKTPNSLGVATYVGKYWSGYCTYSQNFANYSGVATGYYAHTWSSTVINSVTFGVTNKEAGVQISFSSAQHSFDAYGLDRTF